MGNTRSAFFEQVGVDLWWNNDQADTAEADFVQAQQTEIQTTTNANEDQRMEVNQEISTLHEKRLKLIAEKKKEFDDLRRELEQQKSVNEGLKQMLQQGTSGVLDQKLYNLTVDVSQQTDTFEVPGQLDTHDVQTMVEELRLQLDNVESVKQRNRDLVTNVAELQKELQSANSELSAYQNERQEYKTHVTALKDIVTVSKQLLLMRESQIKELTQKVGEIQASLAEKEFAVLSDDMRAEYVRQLKNIKQLKVLYEERQQADRTQIDSLKNQLEDAKNALKAEEARNNETQVRVDELEKDSVEKSGTIINLQSQLGFSKAECAELRAEMAVINQLFSQILLGFNNGQEIDMDKLIRTLEENHDLLTDIVINEECNQISSALPKVLLDLVSQVNDKSNKAAALTSQEEPKPNVDATLATIAEESESQTSTQQNSLSSASEIVQNLPKVWRILTELLSHQIAPASVLNEENEQSDKNPCYKSVQTPTGSTMVLSVSKTYIRLKNLILEKKSLEKETTRLKQLNTHLETRLQDQEKRLETVSSELSKTWNVVGKMQKQHQQLHTQEKILRYELAQKRKLLNELKEELEYCREKWLQAREKNTTTEAQWKELRTEFASRKNIVSEDLNNSVESGYSDDRETSSSDDDDVVESELNLSVPSPEPVQGCSGPSENSEAISDDQNDTGSVETVVNVVCRGTEQQNETILKVVQDEIAKIESTDSLGAGSSSQQLKEVELDKLCSQTISPLGQFQETTETGNLYLTSANVEDVHSNILNCTSSQSPTLVEQQSAECRDSSLSQTHALQGVDDTINCKPTLYQNIMDDSCSSSSMPATEETIVEYQRENATNEEIEASEINESSLPVQQNETESSKNSKILPKETEEDVSRLENSQSPNSDENETSISEHLVECFSSPQYLTVDENTANDHTDEQDSALQQPEGTRGELQLECSESTRNIANENSVESLSSHQPKQEGAEITLNEDEAPEEYLVESSKQQSANEQEDIVLDRDGSTEAVHSNETLKTELVQNECKKVQKTSRTPEEILAAREERLKRLEQQAKDLVTQTTNTSNRSIEICTKLEDLHEQYGTDPKSRRKDIDDMYKKLEEDILQTIKKTKGGEEYPSTSRQYRTTDEILAAREERLKRLEEESSQLVNQATRTSHRSTEIISMLDNLHQQYGEVSEENQQQIGQSDHNSDENAKEDVQEDVLKTMENTQNEDYSLNPQQNTTSEENLTATLDRVQQLEESTQLLNKAAISSDVSTEASSDNLNDQSSESNKQTEETDKNLENLPDVSFEDSEAGTSSSRSPEDILARREERLQRMEEEARELMGKALRNSFRGVRFCTKLDKLHDRYGTSSESSDDGADDNNNTADDVQNGDNTHNEGQAQNTEDTSDCSNSNQGESSQKEEQS